MIINTHVLNIFKTFLDDIPTTNNYKFIDKYIFKKLISTPQNPYAKLKTELLPHYSQRKRKYLLKEDTYTTFMTVIRQLCKLCCIKYNSKIKYRHSSYFIEYYIYLDV